MLIPARPPPPTTSQSCTPSVYAPHTHHDRVWRVGPGAGMRGAAVKLPHNGGTEAGVRATYHGTLPA